ncbi:MAG: hypothetical protein EZS28_014455 [Streblomastix strix]|uniref:Tail specific protease domain-containing protein n=1 Tax=Streblomastix strix TaxID=222440 RepID=A0A5J4W526_9EUKA|nr:MAG: hypothetical protein EZS28_014455 [Streblomastix strix]
MKLQIITDQEKEVTIQQLKKYFGTYPFRDIILDPPSPPRGYGANPINFFKRLDDIASWSHTNTFDFYQNITQLVNELHCAHTVFEAPCFSHFKVKFPFQFNFEIDSEGKHKVSAKYQDLDSPYDDFFSDDLYYGEITHMNLLGNDIRDSDGNLNEGSYPIEEAISIWADDNEQFSRNPYAREEVARVRSFYDRPLSRYLMPKNTNVTIEYLDWEEPTQTSVEYAVALDQNIDILDNVCQIDLQYRGSSSKQDNKVINKTIKKKELNKAPIDKKQQAKRLSEIMKKAEYEMYERMRDQMDPHWRETAQKINQMVQKHAKEIKDSKMKGNETSLEYKSNSQRNINDIIVIQSTKDASVIGFFIQSLKLGIIRISTFAPEDLAQFQYAIFSIVHQFADESSVYKANKIFIDLRYNGGGYTSLVPILFRFLFPQADEPYWPPRDFIKSDLNEIVNIITENIVKNNIDQAELNVDEQTGDVIYDYYNQVGQQRTTSTNDDGSGNPASITVDMTRRGAFYVGHMDLLRNYSKGWNMNRKVIWEPKDIFLLVNGHCASSCAIFTKNVHQKNVGRIVGLGNFGGIHTGIRYNAGTAGGSSVRDAEYFQQLLQEYRQDETQFEGLGLDPEKFPGPFFRLSTKLRYVEAEFYGISEETKNELNEFYIYDADINVDIPEQYEGNVIKFEIEYQDFYKAVISSIENKLKEGSKSLKNRNNKNTGKEDIKLNDEVIDFSKYCLSGEKDFISSNAQKDCAQFNKDDIHAVYGYKCSVTDSKEREADGSKKVGVFIEGVDGCVFSHCQAGYHLVNEICEQEKLFFREAEDEVRPPENEPQDPKEEEIPDEILEDDKVDDKKKINGWMVAGIILIVLLVIVIALSVILAVYIIYQRKKQQKIAPNTEMR